MIVTKEVFSKNDFDFWGGARDTVKYLTDKEVETIFGMLNNIEIEMTETDLNNFFWFENDIIADWLGYNSFDEIMEREE